MSEISYSETTTTDLNNIAIDLGATTFSCFKEGEPYAVSELNNITKELTTAGILTGGNECKAYLENSIIYVNTGIIIFANGAKLRITEAIQMTLINSAYIYALNDDATNTATLNITTTEPTSGDFVMIASTDSSGTLTDRRTFSTAKVNTPQVNSYLEHQFAFDFEGYSSGFIKLMSYEMGKAFNYVICKGMTNLSARASTSLIPDEYNSDGFSKEMYIDNDKDYRIKFVRNGTTVDIYGYCSWSQGGSTQYITLIFL